MLEGPAQAENLRIATYNAELSRRGPGQLLRDIVTGKDPQITAVIKVLSQLDADVLALTNFDYDYDSVALSALAEALGQAGTPYPYRFALRPNTGWPTGLDLDGDGKLGGPRDAQGFGYFSGQGGMAVLSRMPINTEAVRDFSGFLWRDLPGALLPDGMTLAAQDIQRLSTTGHWEVPVLLAEGQTIRLLLWHATPPVFDGPEDRNGRRNHDEAAFWLHLIDGALAAPAPQAPFVLLGDANLDPIKGDGLPAAITALLAHPKLQEVPTAQTALFAQTGGLRVDYLLPSSQLQITASGVLGSHEVTDQPTPFMAASRHLPVWADITLP
ncbi:MAG: hypothetical protein ACJASV_000228 [Pseudorhodobacter sp.]